MDDEREHTHSPGMPWQKLRQAFGAPSGFQHWQHWPIRRWTGVLYILVVSSAILFVVASLALALGLGLSGPRHTRLPGKTTVQDDYADDYGILKDLPVIPHAQLINKEELDLNTDFLVRSGHPRIREYIFNISQALAAPDGFQKPMILVNGQSPGPLIEANSGDTVRIHVHNNMPETSTTIHWHGIDQKNTTWMDGVVGVSQCGIPPGHSFTYEFRLDGHRGTFWWHAHSSIQYSDGLYGPIVVHDPDEMVPKTDDDKIVFVGDVYHTYGPILLESYLNATSRWAPFESGVEPLADSILLNGQNTYDCTVVSTTYPLRSTSAPGCNGGQRYTTKVHAGQRVRLRLINASSFLAYWLSIDNHLLSIVELDGVEISPVTSRGVYLNIGQRASVLVSTNQPPGNYYIRATLPRSCFLPYAPYTSAGLASSEYAAKGILSYDEVAVNVTPIGAQGNVSNPHGVQNNDAKGDIWEGCDDMPFDLPKPMRERPAYDVPEQNKHYIEYVFRQAQDVNRIFINKTAYTPLNDNATLWKAVGQKFAPSESNSYSSWNFGLNQQVLLIPSANKGAQLVINSRDAMEHPWHLHGHTFQVVGWGPGLFGTADEKNGSITTTKWNLANPMRRDTVTVPAFSHIVIRFKADNPGLWALHCHVAWHMEGGMFVSIVESPDDLTTLVETMDPAVRSLSKSFCAA